MLDLDSPLAPHAQLRTLRQELDLYQPGLPWARSRRAVIAAWLGLGLGLRLTLTLTLTLTVTLT